MKNRIIVFIFLIASFLNSANAQKILLEENIKFDYKKLLKGPNRKHFYHFYLDYGFFIGQSEGEGADINPSGSSTFAFGFRYKHKVLKYYALGYDISFFNTSYALGQDADKKLIPNSIIHDLEKLKFNNLGIELYQRFNVDKRGNRIGKFFDMGVYGNWAFSVKHLTKDIYDSNNAYHAGVIKTMNKKLDYVEHFNYGIRARLGVNRFVLSATYRMSDLFNEKFHNDEISAELPHFSIGLQLGLHR